MGMERKKDRRREEKVAWVGEALGRGVENIGCTRVRMG